MFYTALKVQVNALLLKKVKRGTHYALVPKRVYAYCSVKDSLAKLYSRDDFGAKCEHWRERQASPGVFLDVYDGKVWKECYNINGKPFLQEPFNLCLKLNVD